MNIVNNVYCSPHRRRMSRYVYHYYLSHFTNKAFIFLTSHYIDRRVVLTVSCHFSLVLQVKTSSVIIIEDFLQLEEYR